MLTLTDLESGSTDESLMSAMRMRVGSRRAPAPMEERIGNWRRRQEERRRTWGERGTDGGECKHRVRRRETQEDEGCAVQVLHTCTVNGVSCEVK